MQWRVGAKLWTASARKGLATTLDNSAKSMGGTVSHGSASTSSMSAAANHVGGARENSSKASMALAAYINDGPPPM